MGGATPGDAHAFRLFANPGNDNDWINIKLIGVKSNRKTSQPMTALHSDARMWIDVQSR